MGLNKTADGRYIVGQGVENGNENHGFNGKRDIVIQLTADGATADGLNALEYLKAYALNAKTENKPIFPDGARVWISTNGYSKAVEADDVVIDGSNITIGGIVWNGSAWDYSGAGQVASGLPEVDADDNGKVLTVVDGTWAAANGGGSGGGALVVHDVDGTLDKTWQEIHDSAPLVWQTDGDGGYRILVAVFEEDGDFIVTFAEPQPHENIMRSYVATSASGYPASNAQ